MKILVHETDFDPGAEINALHANQPKAGAVASFVGLVRDLNDGDAVTTLTLEHYPAMTEKSLRGIVEEAMQRWSLLDATVIHRVGVLQPLDRIVFVGVASMHRGEAFAACAFIMDYLKTRAPFWKKENTPEGSRWVEARQSDEDAATRWEPTK
jgi:molybdopterin synthase catalytic subunit